MTRIILLDIDGVLVQPGGYRAALRATVQRFVGNFHVEEDLLTDLEKRGISSEWDMAPLIIAAYWDNILSRYSIDDLSENVTMASRQIQGKKIDLPNKLSIPEFELIVGQYPAETAFRSGFFSHIPEALRRNLLMDTRNVHKSATMRVFQHFTLGSERFEETYQLSAEFEAESFLLTEDKANISQENIARLKHPNHFLSAFTARPSGVPREYSKETNIGYAPEAELALELVGLTDIPLMAFGKLEYIAAQHGLDPATLVKPSPFQALAGTLAAWTGSELEALNATQEWHNSGKLNGQFSQLPKSFELIVVEDTIGGIRSVQKVAEILRQHGYDVHTLLLGLTNGIESKADVFTKAGIQHISNWDNLIKVLESFYDGI